MRSHLLLRPQWWLAALAAAGVVVTHAVSYRLAEPGHAHRAELLQDTGHELWPSFVAAAALAALVLCLARALTPTSGGLPVRSTATRLAVLQGAGWLAAETLERVATGHHELTLRSLLPVALGVAVQLAVAVVGAVVLAFLGRLAEAWRGRRRRVSWPRRAMAWCPELVLLPKIRVVAAAWSPRGPPPR